MISLVPRALKSPLRTPKGGAWKALAHNVLPIQGLDFPGNGAAGSDIRISFEGANRPSRTYKTVIWDAWYRDQAGYFAWLWDHWGDDVWHDGTYECGMHPFPCDGAFDGNGLATGGTGGSGTDHFMEIAGAGDAVDAIATPGGTSYAMPVETWVKHAGTFEIITVTTTNDTIEQIFYVDLSDTSKFIRRRTPVSSLASPGSPKFSFGSSPWRKNIPSAGQNDETPNGRYRNYQIYNNAKLSTSDIVSESNRSNNSAVTVAGQASAWYSNISPTPTDISDKSGAGHDPVWANANRPTLFTL